MIHYNPIQCNRTKMIMIKFNDQLQRKQIDQNGFLAAQTTVKRYENKTNKKDQPTNNIKNNRKIKAMEPWTTMPEVDRWEILILNLICYFNPGNEYLLPGFKIVLGSIRNNL